MVDVGCAVANVAAGPSVMRTSGIGVFQFGRQFAASLKQRRPKPGDQWHLGEAFIRIGGKVHHPWRSVDQNGVVLDISVRKRRDTDAAKRFFR